MSYSDIPILIVIGNYKNGGNAKQASILANGFAESGKKVTIIVTREMSEKCFFELNPLVNVVHVGTYRVPEEQRRRYHAFVKKTFLGIKAKKALSCFCGRNAVRRKLIGYSNSKKRKHLTLRWILETYKNPVIIPLGMEYAVDVYGVAPGNGATVILATKTYAEGELRAIDKDVALAVLKGISCVVCQTQYTKEYFSKMGVSDLEVIPNPMRMDVPPYGGKRSKRIVNFCRISGEKRLELLMEAFARFRRTYPEYRVDIYGNIINEQEKAYKSELLEKLAALGLSDVFKIHPAVKNIHETVRDAAMFISTSEFEGLSNSMIEAMALGIPCICTDCDGGGAREMIEDGVNGLLVPKNNVELLCGAMEKYAENPQFAEKCGKAAVAIRQKISIESVISQWNRVIEKYC